MQERDQKTAHWTALTVLPSLSRGDRPGPRLYNPLDGVSRLGVMLEGIDVLVVVIVRITVLLEPAQNAAVLLHAAVAAHRAAELPLLQDRKSTRLNSSHGCIAYAVVC